VQLSPKVECAFFAAIADKALQKPRATPQRGASLYLTTTSPVTRAPVSEAGASSWNLELSFAFYKQARWLTRLPHGGALTFGCTRSK
jgi:hypothetical protein